MRIPLPSPVTTASAARDVERPASVDRAALPPTSALLALSGDQITLFLSPFVSRLSLVVPFISLPNPLPSFLCPPPSGSEQQPVPGGPGSGSQVQPALQSAGGWRNRAPPGPVPIPSFKDTQQRSYFLGIYYALGVGFPVGAVVKNPFANAGDVGSIPELGRSPGEGMDRGAW